MLSRPLVIYHGDCPDGFGAAWAAWKKFGQAADYLPARHGDPLPDCSGRELYFLDFACSPTDYHALVARGNRLLILDHHASAARKLGGLPGAHFEMQRSGAVLAWRHFHPGEPLPYALACIEDQDLWTWLLAESRPFNFYLAQFPFDFAVWDKILTTSGAGPRWDSCLEEGAAIARWFDRQLASLAEHGVRPVTLGGIAGLAVNANHLFASELGHLLAKRCGTFALVWHANERGEVACSLRSVGDCDVASLAEAYGGGGHPQAAKFRLAALAELQALLASSQP